MARSQTLWRRPPARSPLDREIARLAVPAFGALIAEPLYVLTDTAVVGHLGTPQLAGLAVASTVLLTLYTVFIFLAYGTTAAVSRLLGAGDEREAAHQAVQSMWLALLIAGVLPLMGGGAGDMRFLAWAMIIAAAVFIPAALLVLALDAGIGWLWASLGLLMATRASMLLARFTSDRWIVLGARR